MSKNDQDVLGNSNSNSENVEEKLVSLKEIGKKLEEELGHIQDIGGKLIAEHENIGSIVGHVKKIQSEIENTKQLLVKFQAKEDKKERCNRDLTPQKLFEEFREKFKEDKKNREKSQYEINNKKFFNKLSLISFFIGTLLIIFLIIYLSMCFPIKKLSGCFFAFIIFVSTLIYVWAFFYYKRLKEKETKEQNTRNMDILVLFFCIVDLFIITNFYGQHDLSPLFSLVMNILSWDRILCIIVVMILLIKLDYMDNSFKLLLAEEKKQAVLSIKQVLIEREIPITVDLIRMLVTSKDEIGSDLFSVYKVSIIKSIVDNVAIVSLIFASTLSLLVKNNVINILLVIAVFISTDLFVAQYYKDIHDRDLYIEALKDMEFKEALEISK